MAVKRNVGTVSLVRPAKPITTFESKLYLDNIRGVIFTNFPGFRREVLDPYQSRWSRSLHQDPKKRELGMFQIQVEYLWLTVSMHNSDDKLLKCRDRVVILQSNYFKVFLFTHIVVLQIGVSVIHTYQIKKITSENCWTQIQTNSDLFYNHTLMMIVS